MRRFHLVAWSYSGHPLARQKGCPPKGAYFFSPLISLLRDWFLSKVWVLENCCFFRVVLLGEFQGPPIFRWFLWETCSCSCLAVSFRLRFGGAPVSGETRRDLNLSMCAPQGPVAGLSRGCGAGEFLFVKFETTNP